MDAELPLIPPMPHSRRGDSASVSAFTAKRNLDVQCPQKSLRATQAASQRARIFGPAGTVPVNAVSAAIGAGRMASKIVAF
jgi:hypothetical protein